LKSHSQRQKKNSRQQGAECKIQQFLWEEKAPKNTKKGKTPMAFYCIKASNEAV